MEQDVTAERFVDVDQCRERLVVDDHGFGCVDTLGLLLADDHRDDVAHEAHGVAGDEGELHLLVEHAHVGTGGLQVDVGCSPHVENARHRQGFRGVDRKHARVRH